jgi:hypothetical protein
LGLGFTAGFVVLALVLGAVGLGFGLVVVLVVVVVAVAVVVLVDEEVVDVEDAGPVVDGAGGPPHAASAAASGSATRTGSSRRVIAGSAGSRGWPTGRPSSAPGW